MVFGGNALPVGQVSVSLGGLGTKVGQVAGEKKIVLRRDGKRVAHEGGGVDDQGAGHRAGDTVETVDVSTSVLVIGERRRNEALSCGFKANGSRKVKRTYQDPSVCPSQPQWGYRSWRRGPRSLQHSNVSKLFKRYVRDNVPSHPIGGFLSKRSIPFPTSSAATVKSSPRPISAGKHGGKLGEPLVRTRRADIVQHLVGADLGVDSLDSSSHDELLGAHGGGSR